MTARRQDAQRAERAAQLAEEYGVEARAGNGRYAAVVERAGRRELTQGDHIHDLLQRGELLALVNLDLADDGAAD